MKSKSYKNYRECPICKQVLPLTRDCFKRYGNVGGYHQVCKECEKQLDIEKEWKDGLLLCHNCLQYKTEDNFTPNSTKSVIRNNRRHICKECATKRQRNHDLELSDNEKLEKCLRWRFLAAKDRAVKHNISFNLELQYILDLWDSQKGVCALSGLPMTFELKQGRISTNVSIDKIDRTLGYVKGNIQLVCMACNQIKSDLTEIEMYNFCKNIVKNYENKNNINTTK